jgi:hypothetical protein
MPDKSSRVAGQAFEPDRPHESLHFWDGVRNKDAGHRTEGSASGGHAFKTGVRARARRRVRFASASAAADLQKRPREGNSVRARRLECRRHVLARLRGPASLPRLWLLPDLLKHHELGPSSAWSPTPQPPTAVAVSSSRSVSAIEGAASSPTKHLPAARSRSASIERPASKVATKPLLEVLAVVRSIDDRGRRAPAQTGDLTRGATGSTLGATLGRGGLS